MANPFVERLSRGSILCDGAMGTLLYERGVPFDSCFDEVNLSQPTLVVDIHREYIAAGSEIIETNSFGANRFKLEQFGLASQVRQINMKAARNAREAREISGQPVLIAGSVGPTGRTLPPIGTASPEQVRAAYREQISALLEGGVDLLIIETISSLVEMREALLAARDVSDLPIVAQLTFAQDGRTVAGNTSYEVVDELRSFAPDVIGANCSVGPRHTLDVLRSMQRYAPDDLRLAGQPNAGWPMDVGGRVIYPSSPEYFAGYARDAAELGLALIGGCCGTTPMHIRSMREALDALRIVEPEARRERIEIGPQRRREMVAPDGPTLLARKLGQEFVVSVEIDPPKGLNPRKTLAGALLLKEAGVDFINVADSPMARVRMSALTLCYLIQHQAGVETILHFTTRDRNLMGLQSDLIGAHALGVRNIIALTGDPPSLGDYPNATPVYDVDSIGLVRVIKSFNQGVDAAGASIGQMASFTVAVAADPTRPDLVEEATRLNRKIEAGADLVMTQPVFDISVWTNFLRIYTELFGPIEIPVLLGVLPLQSHRHAEFLHNEVPGITLTEEARTRMRLAGSDGRREGVKLAQELLQSARDMVHGVYIMPSFGRYEVAAEVLDVLEDRRLSPGLLV
ncbi:MAG TPA: bifunctional homocysteine S-methyltransferase/methylenetetrahydrofolate reductase [Nitrolancea sp.]|nr:bifunctional homocysteine S-methyltransferase/methylenetetrahydrofolate reductase [Nitrolancea sp.]